jgi:hypothetical protein
MRADHHRLEHIAVAPVRVQGCMASRQRSRMLLNSYFYPLPSIPKFYLVIATSAAEQKKTPCWAPLAAVGMNFA